MAAGILDDRLYLGACHGWELRDEVVDRIAAAQVVEEGVNGDTGACETGGAAEDIGVGDNLVHGITVSRGARVEPPEM